MLYYDGMRCPACRGQHWIIRTVTAECGACQCPVILNEPNPIKDGSVEIGRPY